MCRGLSAAVALLLVALGAVVPTAGGDALVQFLDEKPLVIIPTPNAIEDIWVLNLDTRADHMPLTLRLVGFDLATLGLIGEQTLSDEVTVSAPQASAVVFGLRVGDRPRPGKGQLVVTTGNGAVARLPVEVRAVAADTGQAPTDLEIDA